MKAFYATALLAVLAGHAFAATVQEDLLVYTGPDYELRADIYLPEGPGPHPTILYIHGGGWDAGSRKDTAPQGQRIAPRGWALVATSYRLSDTATHPAQLEDIARALHWLHTEGEALGLSTDRVALWGDSAGGHLAALTSYQFTGEPRITAVILGNAAIDLADSAPPYQYLEMKAAKLLGCDTVANCPDLATEANPMTHVDAADPATLIFLGEADTIVPPRHSVALHDALTSAGVTVELVSFPGEGHGIPSYFTAESTDRIVYFLRTHQLGNHGEGWRVE